MASLLLSTSCFLPLATITKPNSNIQLQHSVPFSSSRRYGSLKSASPLFSPTHQLSSRTLTKAKPDHKKKTKAKPDNPIVDIDQSVDDTNAAPVPTPVTPIAKIDDSDSSVEHLILFEMKDPKEVDPNSKLTKEEVEENLIRAMNSLRCMPGVLSVTSGYLNAMTPSSGYKVFMHTRHGAKEDVAKLLQHPLKFGFTMTYTEPYYKDYIAIDYVFGHNGPFFIPKVGNAYRMAFFNLKDGWGEVTRERVVQAASESFKEPEYQSIGVNFSVPPTYIPEGAPPPPPANKGYTIGTLAVYPDLDTIHNTLGTTDEFAQGLKDTLKLDLNEGSSVMVIDYEIKIMYEGNRENLWDYE